MRIFYSLSGYRRENSGKPSTCFLLKIFGLTVAQFLPAQAQLHANLSACFRTVPQLSILTLPKKIYVEVSHRKKRSRRNFSIISRSVPIAASC